MIFIGLICLIVILVITLLTLLLIYFSNELEFTGGSNKEYNPFDSCKVTYPRYIKINSLVHNDFNVLAINDSRIISNPRLRVMFWKTKNGMQCLEIIQPEMDKKNNPSLIAAPVKRDKNVLPIIIDILKYNNQDVRDKGFGERMKLLELTCQDIKIDFPKYMPFKHYEHFGKQFKKIMGEEPNLVKCMYFKSNNKPYTHPTSSYQWIDKNLLDIYVVSDNIKKHHGFDFATDEFPIDVLLNNFIKQNNKKQNNKKQNNKKQIYRIYRDDDDIQIGVIKQNKLQAEQSNSSNKNTWIEMNKGIAIDGFLGNTIDYLKKLHRNASEYYLYKHLNNNKSLLDIGAGRGNYFRMWKQKHLNVYAVEPNPEFYKQLVAKQKFYKFKSLQAYGQDYDKIIDLLDGEKMDYITMIYTLTFFFKDEDTLDILVKLIDNSLKEGGMLFGQVMDGKKLLESKTDKTIYSDHKSSDVEEEIHKVGTFDCSPFKIKLYQNSPNQKSSDLGIAGKVYIHIDDPVSLVHDQCEYIVDFDKFVDKLKVKGIELQQTGFLNKEADLLNKCPKWFTHLARWFIFKKI